MPRRSRAPAKGDLTPGLFVTSLLRLGIVPSGADGTAGESSEPPKYPAVAGGGGNAPDDVSSSGAVSAAAATANANASSDVAIPTRRTLPCTDGGIEALRLCHAEFIALVASELASAPSSSSSSETAGQKKKSRKRTRPTSKEDHGCVDDASIARGDNVEMEKVSKTLNEKDVLACMDRLGMGRIGTEAMRNVKLLEKRRRVTESSSASPVSGATSCASAKGESAKIGSALSASASSSAAKKAGKKLKKGFKKKDVTKELIAEQERLLAESARAVRERMARQQSGGGDSGG